MNLIEELQWRGMIQDIIPGTEEQLMKEMTSGYVGFDPTSDSLHVGSLIPILLLVHLQKAGHKPYALVGGATGMVGDPSGKSEERNLLDLDTLRRNQEGVKNQLMKFLDFSDEKENKAEMVNNYDWFSEMYFLDFIRDVGKHITVNYMLAKDSVKKRLETGMSFTEFSYQLVQGYDFYYLSEHHDVNLQMGGSDQWGNIVTGTELIRRKSRREAFAFTCPLLTKSDGSKFGKSEEGNIWLDPEKTSPYKFYQFWLNVDDKDAQKFIKIFTFLSPEEIEALIRDHEGNEHMRLIQKKLAEELTILVHGSEQLDFVREASAILFSNDTEDLLRNLSKSQISDIMEGVPQGNYAKAVVNEGVEILDFLADVGFMKSKSDIRRALKAGSVRINKAKVSETYRIGSADILADTYVLVQNGKKNYFLVALD